MGMLDKVSRPQETPNDMMLGEKDKTDLQSATFT